MRLPALLAVLALAACGSDESEPSAADAMREFVAEAGRGEHGPTYSEGVGSYAGTDFEVILDERWDGTAIVAIEGERLVEGSREIGVYAAPFELRNDRWEIQLGILPNVILDTYGVRVEADEVRIWLDGEEAELARDGNHWRPAAEPAASDPAVVVAIRKGGRVYSLGWKGAVGPPP